MAYTTTGGAGGSSVIINEETDVVSTDNSVKIEKTTVGNIKTFDLSVPDSGDTVIIESEDNSIDVVESEGAGGEKQFNLEVNQEKLSLVTELQNGLMRSVDKKTLDKTFINTVSQFDLTQYISASAASAALHNLTNGFYSPVHLSMLSWLGTDGNNHISRYIDLSRISNESYTWDNIAYGIVNDQPTWLAMAFNKAGSSAGGNALFARSIDGYNWSLIESNLSLENYVGLTFWNGYFVATSINQTSELIYSSDGGLTWSLYTINHSGYMFNVKSTNNKLFYLGQYVIDEIDLSVSPISEIFRPSIGTPNADVYDITSDNNYYYVATSKGVYVYDINTWAVVSNSENSQRGVFIDCYGSLIVLVSANGLYWLSSDQGTTWTSYNYFSTQSYKISRIVFGANYCVCVSPDSGSMFYSSDCITWTEIIFNDLSTANSQLVSVVYDGTNFQIISGTFGVTRNLNSANCTLKVSPNGWNVINKYWQEVPVMEVSENKLLMANNGFFSGVSLGENLSLINSILAINQSDRHTDYSNYISLPLVSNAPYSQIFSTVSRNEIINDSSIVYSDESCINAVGVIHDHNYNVNNPNQIIVTINGSNYTYYFYDSKTPISIATTKALIDALASVVHGELQPSNVENQVLKTVLNNGNYEIAWSNDWNAGFEPYSYMDAQEVGIPYQNDVTSALLVRFLPDSKSVLKSISFVITQGAQKNIRCALYDENRNLLATTDLMTMAVAGAFTLDLSSNVSVNPYHSYFIGVMTTGNGYQLLGRNINIGANNILPCCFQSQNNLQNNEFPQVFDNSIIQGTSFIPYLQANGLF